MPVTLTFDLWPWHSNSSQRGTKYVFSVNLVQIRSAVPEIFYTQTKKVTYSAKNRTLRSSLHAVIMQMYNTVIAASWISSEMAQSCSLLTCVNVGLCLVEENVSAANVFSRARGDVEPPHVYQYRVKCTERSVLWQQGGSTRQPGLGTGDRIRPTSRISQRQERNSATERNFKKNNEVS